LVTQDRRANVDTPTSSILVVANALLQADILTLVTKATSDYVGKSWDWDNFTDLSDRASHPCGIFRSRLLSVFAKLSADPLGRERFEAELKGLALLRSAANARTPTPIGAGVIVVSPGTFVLLFEGLSERQGDSRTSRDWRAMGQALAALHHVRGEHFGLDDFDGYFGPLPQDNRPTSSTDWADFYAERRLGPRLRDAVDSGHLPMGLAGGVEHIIRRVSGLSGPEPQPALLHGDPQQNNIVSTDVGPVLIDAAPYFGHPEADLALVDLVEPVPRELFDGYKDEIPIDSGFSARRQLWRLHADLAAVAVGGVFGRSCLSRITDAIDLYR
jgi:fructosamine-3-kinase